MQVQDISQTPFFQEKLKYKNECQIMVEKQTASREGKSSTWKELSHIQIQFDAIIRSGQIAYIFFLN